MEERRLIFTAIFARFPKAALLLGFVVIGLVFAAPAQAQEVPPQPIQRPNSKGVSAHFKRFTRAKSNDLEKRQQDSKALYDDGLISRIEFENGEKALADARAKVEELAKEIAAANKPAPVITPNIALMSGSSNQAWTTGNSRIDGLIRQNATLHGIDPYLIYCLMSQESSFSVGATSPKGAQGLMQLMPGTAARYGVTNPYDVAQNIRGGTRYLKDLLKMFNGRVDLALAGYNAGEGAVMKYGYTIPPYNETRNYVKLILKRYNSQKTAS